MFPVVFYSFLTVAITSLALLLVEASTGTLAVTGPVLSYVFLTASAVFLVLIPFMIKYEQNRARSSRVRNWTRYQR